jgi:hypothetical protein
MICRNWLAPAPLLVHMIWPMETTAPSPDCGLNGDGVVPLRLAGPTCAVRTVASVVTAPAGSGS